MQAARLKTPQQRDVVIRGQLRQQRKRQAKLRINHYKGKHVQVAIKCPLCSE